MGIVTKRPIITSGSGGGSGGGGTTNHPDLLNRDAPEQHPLSSITNNIGNGLDRNAQVALDQAVKLANPPETTSLTFRANPTTLANASNADTVASFVGLSDGSILDVGKVIFPNHGYTVGVYYYLSETDNTFQTVPPSTIGSYTQSLFHVYDANTLLINIQQAIENVEVDTGGGGVTQSGLYLLGRSIWKFSGNSPIPTDGGFNILFPTTGAGVEVDDPLGIFGNANFGVVFPVGTTHYRLSYSFYYFNQTGTSGLVQTIDFGVEVSSGLVNSYLDVHNGGFYFENKTTSGDTIFSGTFASSIVKVSDAEHPAIVYIVSTGLNSLFKSIRIDIECYKEIV